MESQEKKNSNAENTGLYWWSSNNIVNIFIPKTEKSFPQPAYLILTKNFTCNQCDFLRVESSHFLLQVFSSAELKGHFTKVNNSERKISIHFPRIVFFFFLKRNTFVSFQAFSLCFRKTFSFLPHQPGSEVYGAGMGGVFFVSSITQKVKSTLLSSLQIVSK